jgi:archaellum biogenesis ATPase FlaH
VDFSEEQDLDLLMGKLGLGAGPCPQPPIGETKRYGIARGNLVLLQGMEPGAVSQAADILANGLLGERRTMTFISTKRDTQDVLRSMFKEPSAFSRAMRDMRLLVIPVYPILQGSAESRAPLLDKLIAAPQLFGREIIIIDQMTDFLEKGMGDVESLSIWPFLRKLTNSGKVVVLCVGEEHPAVSAIRSACTIDMSVSRSDDGRTRVKVGKASETRPHDLMIASFDLGPKGELRPI